MHDKDSVILRIPPKELTGLKNKIECSVDILFKKSEKVFTLITAPLFVVIKANSKPLLTPKVFYSPRSFGGILRMTLFA